MGNRTWQWAAALMVLLFPGVAFAAGGQGDAVDPSIYRLMVFVIAIFVGYYVTEYQLGVAVESMIVLSATVAGCALGYELVRRIPGIGILFGVHTVSGYHPNRLDALKPQVVRE